MALEEIGGVESTSGISRLTTEYLYWHITSDSSFSAATAEVAFMPQNTTKPQEVDWNTATMTTNPDNVSQESIQLLVGPQGGVDLTPGTENAVTYSVWVRLTTGTERFVRRAGTLLVR